LLLEVRPCSRSTINCSLPACSKSRGAPPRKSAFTIDDPSHDAQEASERQDLGYRRQVSSRAREQIVFAFSTGIYNTLKFVHVLGHT
jgi:hypothetical protein